MTTCEKIGQIIERTLDEINSLQRSAFGGIALGPFQAGQLKMAIDVAAFCGASTETVDRLVDTVIGLYGNSGGVSMALPLAESISKRAREQLLQAILRPGKEFHSAYGSLLRDAVLVAGRTLTRDELGRIKAAGFGDPAPVDEYLRMHYPE